MASGPLDGVRVLEFSQIIAGPLACQMLSDLGADVIKVEPLEGEPWRLNAQFIPLESKTFQALNRGKRSLAIDMAQPEAQAAVHRLVKEIDVVVINYRPDVPARLGIDYETLSAIRPDLVYIDNTAFGRKGELADQPGYDVVVQAMSGMTSLVGKVDARGVPLAPPPYADTTTAYSMATAVCAALYHRAKTGEGQMIETSLLINALTTHMYYFTSVPAADAEERAALDEGFERVRREGGSYADLIAVRDAVIVRQPGAIYYRCFLTSDGAIAVGALSASLREKLRRVLGVQHNRDEPGYDPLDPEQRRIDAAIGAQVEAQIRAQSCDYWLRAFEAGGVPVGRVNFVQELIDHPQIVANDYVVELEHDLSGPQRMAAPPWKMSATPPRAQGASPPLGRDNDAILTSIGYDPDEIAGLRRRGVIL